MVIYCALEEAFDKIHTPLTLNHSLQDTFTHSFFCFKPFEVSFSTHTHIYKYTDAFNVILLFTPSVYYYHLNLLQNISTSVFASSPSTSSFSQLTQAAQVACLCLRYRHRVFLLHVCLHMLCLCVCGLFCRCIKY